jgi:outer membrane protein insertion porin family
MRSKLAPLVAVAVVCGVAFPSAARARSRVAILPVVVHSGDSQDYLRQGIADMLSARLGQDPEIQVVRIDDAAQATTDLAKAQAAARAAGAEFVLFGSFTRFGEGASLDVQCASVSGGGEDGAGAARQIFVQAGTLGDIIPRLDDLAQRVAYYVKNGEAPAVSAAPPISGSSVSRSELDELRRRVDALERAQRTAPSSPAER